MVVVAIILILALMGSMLTASWVHSARVNEAKSKLLQGFEMARALAQRNPNATRLPNVAAGIKVDGDSLLVCLGDPVLSVCAKDAAAMRWWSSMPANTTVVIGNEATSLGIDNTGMPLSTSTYSITNGSVNETGNLH